MVFNSIKFKPVWKKIDNVDTTLECSFHTATFVKSIQSIVVVGGVKYEDGKAVSHYRLGDILFIETQNLSSDKVNLKVENLASLQDVFISGHAVTTSSTEDTYIYCFGGYEQNISNYKKYVNLSSNLYVIDAMLKQAIKKVSPDIFATACHSLTFIHESTLVILGGTNQSINLFTSKALIPDLASKCVVDESFISPVPWIRCDSTCQLWLHQFCINMKVVLKGEFICSDCKLALATNRKGQKHKGR